MFWDRVAGVYDLFVNGINRKTHQALRHIVAELIGPDDRVLECACGTGLLTKVIADKCKALTATDFAPKMLDRVCRDGGMLIIPTYMNKEKTGKTSSFASAVQIGRASCRERV